MTSRREWLEWRRTGWTSTDAARAWTGYYGGAYGAIAEKQGRTGDNIDEELAERGKELEEPIADAVHALTGWWVQGEQLQCRNPDDPLALATIDGMLSETDRVASLDACPAGLEIKTRFVGPDPWPWSYWRVQSNWAMYATGRSLWLLAIGVVDHAGEVVRLEFEWLERDDDLTRKLVEQRDELWAHVEAGTLPDPDCPSALETVKEVNRLARAETEPDIDALAADVERLDEIRTNMPRWKSEADELAARVRHAMGEATQGVADRQWRVRIGQPIRKWTDMARLELELFFPPEDNPDFYKTVLDTELIDGTYPELGERFKEATTDRRLTIKDLKA